MGGQSGWWPASHSARLVRVQQNSLSHVMYQPQLSWSQLHTNSSFIVVVGVVGVVVGVVGVVVGVVGVVSSGTL